jgi:hypothetical protein
VLPGTVAAQRFEPVRRWHSQVIERHRGGKTVEAHLRPPLEVRRQAAHGLAFRELLRSAVAVPLNHEETLTDVVNTVNR